MALSVDEIFALTGKAWEGIRPLGKGGQGQAFLVRSAEARKKRAAARAQIVQSVEKLVNRGGPDPGAGAAPLAEAIAAHNAPDPLSDLAVFKVFDREGSSQSQIQTRFLAEVRALQEIKHSSIVNMLASNHQTPWMVTEYYPNGDLAGRRPEFTGQALKSLVGLRPVVEAVSLLHQAEPPFIHRDIKPANLFVAADNRLVLGDFGIVFRDPGDQGRATELLERVGSRDWIAPWFNKPGLRIEDVRPSFDVYMLGKLLWWMISGVETAFWIFQDDELNVEKLFETDPAMASINRLLAKCMVQYEKECLRTARELLALFDECIERVRGRILSDDIPRTCLVCGIGRYEKVASYADKDPKNMRTYLQLIKEMGGGVNNAEQIYVRARKCQHCGHIQLFDLRGLAAWPAGPPS